METGYLVIAKQNQNVPGTTDLKYALHSFKQNPLPDMYCVSYQRRSSRVPQLTDVVNEANKQD